MAADTEPLEILLHLPLLAEDKVPIFCFFALSPFVLFALSPFVLFRVH
jgi:U4/U6 small nuclear ribonucleoprotein SNU13